MDTTYTFSSRVDDSDRAQSHAWLSGEAFGAFGRLPAIKDGELRNLVGNRSHDEVVVRLEGLAGVAVQKMCVHFLGWGPDSSRRGLPTGAKVEVWMPTSTSTSIRFAPSRG